MFASRLTKLILIAALIMAVVIASYEVIHSRTESRAAIDNGTYVGMGDLRRYEAENLSEVSSEEKTFVGLADLRRTEFDYPTEVPPEDAAYVGMGDLHRYEFLQGQASADD